MAYMACMACLNPIWIDFVPIWIDLVLLPVEFLGHPWDRIAVRVRHTWPRVRGTHRIGLRQIPLS